MFAEILLAKASRGIDKIYHYSIPETLSGQVQIGQQVLVPFGSRQEIGYVIGLVETAEVAKVKDILEIKSIPLFSEKSVELAKWLADYYYSFLITALRLVMPPGVKKTEANKKVRAKKRPIKSETRSGEEQAIAAGLKLTLEQNKAVAAIKQALDKNETEKFLLYGVTGSGKTEVYLQAIAHLLRQGKSAIVLVPEISLTPQLVQRFRERFRDHIAVIHSEITEKVRKEEWARIATGEATIVLGTRSAVFAPIKNLGLIVIDEEYETTYKSDKSPRYHAREVAQKLAALNKAVVVMGSATPSVETYFKAETGAYQKLGLSKRIDDRVLPPVTVIDMRTEKEWLLSGMLRTELRETLSRGEQAILFINRRGFFTFAMCKDCGTTLSCPRCSVSLSYHSSEAKLRCGRCGFTAAATILCPSCHGSAIRYFGTGTQRIEKEVAEVFPAARILRYDRDTVNKRGLHDTFFAVFAEGKADVLIGTQMVTKGLDVANVTLVGVVSADTGLNLPDFRSSEHTFQLLTQVAGRAGRHHLPGKVIIQTHLPDHYVIQAAAKHDYEAFYRQEIISRQELGYPPFNQLINLIFSGQDEKKISKTAEDIKNFLEKRLPGGILGPVPAAIAKLRGDWRYQILIKGQDLAAMRNALTETFKKAVVPREIRVAIDVDPMNML